MALDREIQRVPAGLANVLNLFGGVLPTQLSAQTFGVLELLQSYGLQQKQTPFVLNAALAPNVAQDLALTPANAWGVLFNINTSAGETATIGNLQSAIYLQRGTSGVFVARSFYESLNIAAGGQHLNAWNPPYALLLPPGSIARAVYTFTADATVSMGISAEIGLFG